MTSDDVFTTWHFFQLFVFRILLFLYSLLSPIRLNSDEGVRSEAGGGRRESGLGAGVFFIYRLVHC